MCFGTALLVNKKIKTAKTCSTEHTAYKNYVTNYRARIRQVR